MITEPSISLHGPFSGIDLRLRIVFILFFSFAVAPAVTWPPLFFALAVAALMAGLIRQSLFALLKRLCPACGFLVFLWLVLPFTVPGDPLWHLGFLTLTREGVHLCALITLKSIAILLAFMALSASASIAALGHALQSLGVPEKLVYLFLFCYRYIFVIELEYQRLEKAVRLRAFRPGTNVHTYRTYAYLVAMLFLRSYLRAEQVHKAMVCRGFQGRFFSLETLRFRGRDAWWGLGMLFIIAIVIFLQWQIPLY